MKFRNLTAVFIVLICSAVDISAASFFGLGKKKEVTEKDRALNEAIVKGDWRSIDPLTMRGANPNAKFDDTTLLVHSFEYSLKRDENNKIVGVDSNRSDIARKLVAAGGDIKELERDLPHYLDKAGKPLKDLFESPKAEKEFETFVMHLRNIALQAKGKKI